MGDAAGPKAFARRAEAAGFDSVWCGDHVGHLVDGLTALGILAGATEQVVVGVDVLVVPYRSAAMIAKGLATVAAVAPGRVVAGFGVGGEFPGEFQATNAAITTRGAYADEAIDIAVQLWSGDPVSYRGRFVTLDEFQLEPAPTPPPDIWIGGRSEAAMRRAVRFATGYSPYLVSAQQLASRRARLAELAAEAGRAADELTLACLLTLVPGPDVDAAVELAMASLKLSGLSPESVRACYLLGDDEAIVSRVQEYVDAGMDYLNLGCIPGSAADVEQFFAACGRLLPTLRALVRTTKAPIR